VRNSLRLSLSRLVARSANLDSEAYRGVTAAVAHTLRRLACRIQYLAEEIHDLQQRIATAVKAAAPALLELCAYNKINGIYASQDPWLLTEVLRKEWASRP
jgi:hypothetical protein